MVCQAVTGVTNILCIFSIVILFWNIKSGTTVPHILHPLQSAGDSKSENAKEHGKTSSGFSTDSNYERGAESFSWNGSLKILANNARVIPPVLRIEVRKSCYGMKDPKTVEMPMFDLMRIQCRCLNAESITMEWNV
jgi:hypothetical protein